MIRNLIFDMGNVLIHWDPPRFMERMGLPEEDRALLLTEVFGSVEWIQTDRGTLSFEDGLKEMCARLPERLHRATLDWWKDNLLPVEGMAELVRELKGLGYNIYLLSNAKLDLHQYFDRIPGSECFDGMIVSADWKLLKPQPELYHVLLQEYGLKAEECFFTDDLNINIEAAVLVGMSGTVFRGVAGLRRTLTEAGVPVKAAD
jgi:putative hydrolase of the HAD superfamily